MKFRFATEGNITNAEKEVLINFRTALSKACVRTACVDCAFERFCGTVKSSPDEVVTNILTILGIDEDEDVD